MDGDRSPEVRDDAKVEGPRKKATPKKKRRLWVRVLRGLGFTLLGVFVLLTCVVLYLTTDSGKELARSKVEALLQGRVNGTVALGKLDYELLGPVTLGALTIDDESGRRAISVGELHVAPAWGELGGDLIPLDAVRLSDVAVTVVKREDGSSNLATLFKKREADPNKPPFAKTIEMRDLSISGLRVDVESPTGDVTSVRDLSIAGKIRARPLSKDVAVTLEPIQLALSIKKSTGLEVGVENLKTGVELSLTGGEGTLKLLPVKADVALELPTLGKRAFPLEWEGVTVALSASGVDGSLGKLALDALSLTSVKLKGVLEDGALKGAPEAEVVGLVVDAARLNTFLGREVLRSDVEIGTRVRDEGGDPKIDLSVLAGKTKLAVAAKLTGARGDSPEHDVVVTLTDVDTVALLADPEKKVPPVTVGSLELHAKGRGKSAETLATRAELTVRDLSVRGVPISEIQGAASVDAAQVNVESLDVAALGQKLHVTGTFGRADKKVDVSVGLSGDVGVLLSKLTEAGLPITTRLPERAVVLPPDDLRIGVRGTVGGALAVHAEAKKLEVLGGRLELDADVDLRKGDPAKGEKAVALERGKASVDLTGLRLGALLAARGKALPPLLGLDAGINLHLDAEGTKLEPKIDLLADVTTARRDGGRRLRADLEAHVDAKSARVRLTARDPSQPLTSTADPILSLVGTLPLLITEEERRLDDGRPFDVKLTVPRRTVADLASFAPKILLVGKTLPEAELELALGATGTLARPHGELSLGVRGAFLDPAERALTSRVALSGTLDPTKGGGAELAARLAVALDERAGDLLSGTISAKAPYSVARGGLDALTFDTRLALGPVELSELPDSPKLARARALGGHVEGNVHLHGSRRDLFAEIGLVAKGLLANLTPGGKRGPLDLTATLTLAETLEVDVVGALANGRLLKLGGNVALDGRGLIPRAKLGLDPTLDLTLTIDERDVKSLAPLSPKLAELDGRLRGSGTITGTAKRPLAHLDLGVFAIPMWSGADGSLAVAVDVGQDDLLATLDWGAGAPSSEGLSPAAPSLPLRLSAKVPRDALAAYSAGEGPLTIDASLDGRSIDLTNLVPKRLSDKSPVEPKGTLFTDLTAHVVLRKVDGQTVVEEGELGGALKLDAVLPIPKSQRSFSPLKLHLDAKRDVVVLHELSAHESDHEVKDRSLQVSGEVTLEKLRPSTAKLRIAADRWLLFGTKAIGLADAPRGTLTTQIEIDADLAQPVRKVNVDVQKLSVLFPDRFEKAHQPEDVHVGDVIELRDGAVARGKLPVPESVAAAKAQAQATEPTPAAAPSDAPPSGADVHVVVRPGARLFQSPIDLTTGGSIDVAIRGPERKIRGSLTMTGGELSLGGSMHPLKTGSLTFDDQRPKGFLDLFFEKKLAPWQLRGISNASAGDAVTIHMSGPLSDRKTVLGGAGPGALFDLLAMHNEGRERFVSGPDLPEAATVDFPQHGGLLMLSFIAVNLPHLLFLDRVSGWADPYDAPKAYGRVEHYEAERYFAGGEGRFKASMRPPGVGRSQAEVELDYLFENDPRLLFGIGATGGSRGGGGPGIVLEWSSSD
jgi:hypothetical protein